MPHPDPSRRSTQENVALGAINPTQFYRAKSSQGFFFHCGPSVKLVSTRVYVHIFVQKSEPNVCPLYYQIPSAFILFKQLPYIDIHCVLQMTIPKPHSSYRDNYTTPEQPMTVCEESSASVPSALSPSQFQSRIRPRPKTSQPRLTVADCLIWKPFIPPEKTKKRQ